MSKGIEMMMKSFGFDPELIKNQVSKAGEDFKAVVAHFNSRMDKADADNAIIKSRLDYLISCLKPVDMLVNADVSSRQNHNGASLPAKEV